MGYLPLTRRHAYEQLTVFVDTDCGGRQYLAETIWNESRPPIVPNGNGGISRTKVDADHPISLTMSGSIQWESAFPQKVAWLIKRRIFCQRGLSTYRP
jgi:hypothetical protein